jgi:hypothetical protein
MALIPVSHRFNDSNNPMSGNSVVTSVSGFIHVHATRICARAGFDNTAIMFVRCRLK